MNWQINGKPAEHPFRVGLGVNTYVEIKNPQQIVNVVFYCMYKVNQFSILLSISCL